MSLGEELEEFLLGNKTKEKERKPVKLLGAQKSQWANQVIVIGAGSAVGCGKLKFTMLIVVLRYSSLF
jgi:hypothetical protein